MHNTPKSNLEFQITFTETNLRYLLGETVSDAEKIAHKLGLQKDQYEVCFQSRLGPGWIKPFTDQFYRSLPKQGVKKIAVISPSFTADCLETLEEIKIRGREEFIENGGEDLYLVPSLNTEDVWIENLSQYLTTRE
jgi:ferrochelatase